MADEIMEARLNARMYLYAFYQRVLGDRLTPEVVDSIDVPVLEMAMDLADLLGEGEGVGASEGPSARLVPLLGKGAFDNDALVAIKREYGRIFDGPAALPAPPYESAYDDDKRLIMTKTTLDVRSMYRASGFAPQRLRQVPDDHIALELDFMAHLADRARDAYAAGNESECAACLEASQRFLESHLARWIGRFADDATERANSEFYSLVAASAAQFVVTDAAWLETAC